MLESSKLDGSKISLGDRTFQGCTGLRYVSIFDTSNVTSMLGMFWDCKDLTIPLFDTSKVTDMSHIFNGCDNIAIPLFDTSNVSKMTSMFWGCKDLSIPLFDTSKVFYTDTLFRGLGDGVDNIFMDMSNFVDASSMFSVSPYSN